MTFDQLHDKAREYAIQQCLVSSNGLYLLKQAEEDFVAGAKEIKDEVKAAIVVCNQPEGFDVVKFKKIIGI